MELNYVKEFLELAENCNFQETADSLFIAQSTLSRHMKALEEDLGVQLFDRTMRNAKLSDAAQLFLPYARDLIQIEERGRKMLADYIRSSQGTITIGAIPSMSHYNINEILAEFSKKYKSFSLNLIEGDTMELAQMLQEGLLDFAYMRDVSGDNEMWQQFSRICIGHDYLSAVISKSHPLANRESISIKELQNEKLILLGKESFAYSMSVSCCHRAGFEPHIVFTGKHARNLISMAGSNLGILLLNELSAMHYKTDQVTIIRLVPEIKTQIVLAYNGKKSKMTKAAQFFLTYIANGLTETFFNPADLPAEQNDKQDA